jgi:hypothetical protein
MLQHTHMGLEELRSMDNGDFQIHLRLLLYFREAEAAASRPKKKAPSADEFFSGVKKGGARRFTVNKRIDPATGQWVDRD